MGATLWSVAKDAATSGLHSLVASSAGGVRTIVAVVVVILVETGWSGLLLAHITVLTSLSTKVHWLLHHLTRALVGLLLLLLLLLPRLLLLRVHLLLLVPALISTALAVSLVGLLTAALAIVLARTLAPLVDLPTVVPIVWLLLLHLLLNSLI